jgi:hypothetical protein
VFPSITLFETFCHKKKVQYLINHLCLRRVWRYQRGNQNPYIEEEQTTQWPKKVQKDKQRPTKHTYTTKDRATRTPLKTGSELRCYGRVSNSCSTSDTRRVNLVPNPVISHERGKDREVFTTSRTYPWSFMTQIFHNGQPSRDGDRKTFEVMTSTYLSFFLSHLMFITLYSYINVLYLYIKYILTEQSINIHRKAFAYFVWLVHFFV